MTLLSCQEVSALVKSHISEVFSPDPEFDPATIIMGRPPCNALLNIVHAWERLLCTIGFISSGSFISTGSRLLKVKFKTVFVSPDPSFPPKVFRLKVCYKNSFWLLENFLFWNGKRLYNTLRLGVTDAVAKFAQRSDNAHRRQRQQHSQTTVVAGDLGR